MRQRSWRWPALLVGVYLLLSVAVLAAWSARGVYGVSGDEPHYLVMADSVWRFGSLELTDAYREEFVNRVIYPLGLADPGSPVATPFAHIREGANGAYSWHGPGVALLVALPYALGGILGAKLALIALGIPVVLLAWWISGRFLTTQRSRAAATATVVFAYPLIPASAQIYPDLLAGAAALLGIGVLLHRDRRIPNWALAGTSVALGAMPWLMTKFAPAAAALLAALAWTTWTRRKSASSLLVTLAPAVVLIALLAWYQQIAFGSPLGVSPEGGLQVSATALAVGLGMWLDQDQGLLVQNLVLWVGLAGLVPFGRRDRRVFLVWAFTVLSFWLPGALHPGWYGGGSLLGRYGWGVAVLMIVPTMVGLGLLYQRSRRWFAVIVTVALAWSLGHLALFTLTGGSGPGVSLGIDLYTRPEGTWLVDSAFFAYPLHAWFGAFTAPWALADFVNLGWLLLVVAAILAGLRPRVAAVVAAVAVATVIIAGFVGRAERPQARLQGPPAASSQAGPVGETLRARMRLGTYRWTIDYAAAAPPDLMAARWELVDERTGSVAAAGELAGTAGQPTTSVVELPYRAWHPVPFALRVIAFGQGEVQFLGASVSPA